MRQLLLHTLTYVLFCISANIHAQTEDPLSKDLAIGIAELRQDIFKRKQAYNKQVMDIVARLDSSSINEALKKQIHEFIRQDLQAGALSYSLEIYDLIPESSPYKSIYVEQYIANNQDFQIDKETN